MLRINEMEQVYEHDAYRAAMYKSAGGAFTYVLSPPADMNNAAPRRRKSYYMSYSTLKIATFYNYITHYKHITLNNQQII